MAQQIKKKFIQNDAVDGQKLKLQKDQSIRGQRQDGSEVELLKLDESNKLVSGGEELAFKEVVDSQVLDLQGKLDSEEASRISGDETLQSNLDTEQSAREQADQDLQSSISSEESRAMGVESSLQSFIDEEETARIAGDSAEQTRATGEESRIESKFDSMITSEESSRESADQGLQSQINTEKGRVDAILLASDADKDSFAEIVQLINSVDTENDSAFASYALSNNAALASEVSSRQQGDQDLQSDIDAEESRASDEESRIESKFDGMMASEEAARIAGDSAEQTRAMGVESSLQSQLTQEVSDRQSADSSEASARQSADSSLQSQITQEVSDRQSAISSEASARESAISSEASARQSADSSLQSSLNSEVSARQVADSTEQTARQAADSTEQAARIAADADLQAQHDDLDGYAQDIRGDLDQEIVDRAAAVSSEASARQSADSSLQSSLSSEISRAQSAESTEQAARIAGDASTLQSSKDYTDGKISLVMSNLDTEALDSLVEVVTAFQNADGNLNQSITDLAATASSALATEESARIAGDSAEASARAAADSTEQAARISGDETIQSSLDAYVLQNDINLNSINDLIQTNEENNGAAHESLQSSIEAEMERATGVEQSLEGSVSDLEIQVEEQGSALQLSIDSVSSNLQSEITRATSKENSIESDVTIIKSQIMNINSDLVSLDSRLDAIEAQVDGPTFHKMKIEMDQASELVSVDLEFLAVSNSLVVAVGRLMVHQDEDFTVSVVNGVTRLTWIGDFAAGGTEEIVEGDFIFVTYAVDV